MARRRQKGKRGKWLGRLLTAILALPALYLVAALAGSLIAANRYWTEPVQGTTIFIADNGVHTDLIMPLRADGRDWARRLEGTGFAGPARDASWIAVGSGEQHVYLDTPTWWDLTPRTILAALVGGPRVLHVEYVASPAYASRKLRVRPEEYRRLWAAINADFALDRSGRPRRINHSGYGDADSFYQARGNASALRTCNVVVARWLRLAGIKSSLWPPFTPGLVWRYRRTRT